MHLKKIDLNIGKVKDEWLQIEMEMADQSQKDS